MIKSTASPLNEMVLFPSSSARKSFGAFGRSPANADVQLASFPANYSR